MERPDALREELIRAREQTDMLFRAIAPDALYHRPVAERHRLIFYRGHFDAFDWNLLARRGMDAASLHPTFDGLFERGIDPPVGQSPSDTAADWPAVAEVDEYVTRTRKWLDHHLSAMDPDLVQMAVEHRYMHAETFAYLMHNLDPAAKRGPIYAAPSGRHAPSNRMIDVPAGDAKLGQEDAHFGWDNERRAHSVPVPAFRMSKFKVTNGEFLEFARETGIAPNFWRRDGAQWMLRGIFADVPLPLDHPVWVTWRQASEYAAWKGLSLPSEAQFDRAQQLTHPHPVRDNFAFHRWGTVPVDNGHELTNGHAPVQLTGNGWEWTRDVFAPFEGFAAHPFYAGYSSDFFDGNHYVLKGASPRTAALLTRRSFRNWFRPEYPHMYAGFRLVEN